MATYEVETESGTYEIEVEGTLPDGPDGERLLRRLLQQQLKQQPGLPDPTARPTYADEAQALLGKAKQVVGGVRDSAQSLIELPAQIGNVISEYISPDAPGGPRRRVVPEVQSPQLPDVSPPQGGVEKALRIGGQVLGDAAGALLLPPVRHGVATLGKRRPGPQLSKDLMFTPMRKPTLDYEPGAAAAKGVKDGGGPFVSRRAATTRAEPTDLLKTAPSEGERNLAQLFGFAVEDIPQMSQQAALVRRQQLRHAVPDYATQQEGPLALLLQRLDDQILRFR